MKYGLFNSTVHDLFRLSREDWIDECRETARQLLKQKPLITIKDVTDINPRPKYIHPNTTGTIFRHEDFKLVGFTTSKQPSRHGSIIGLWRLK